MKKLFLLSAITLSATALFAQPWMPKNNTGPVKFADVLSGYSRVAGGDNGKEEAEMNMKGSGKEGKDHLFDKWEWYWKQHLDKDGYIVPPVRTLRSWQA